MNNAKRSPSNYTYSHVKCNQTLVCSLNTVIANTVQSIPVAPFFSIAVLGCVYINVFWENMGSYPTLEQSLTSKSESYIDVCGFFWFVLKYSTVHFGIFFHKLSLAVK